MSWTPVTKPTISAWTNPNPGGRTQYDQATIMYDDPNTFYDGVNNSAWAKITKPSASSWTKIVKPT